MVYEGQYPDGKKTCVAYSPDGLHWTNSPNNPVGPFLEMAGLTKHRGLYYLSGQASFSVHGRAWARRLNTFVSADFEHWSPSSAVGLDRGPQVWGPGMEDAKHQFEEIHLGAALWNRGNVILGIYGQWHGHPSGDRALLTMDLGLALTHDALHEYTHLRVELLDLGCRPIDGYSGEHAATLTQDGLRIPVRWGSGDAVPVAGPVRVKVSFTGIRPEDARLHAVYVGE